MELQVLEARLNALAVFRGLLSDPVMEALLVCVGHIVDGANWDALRAYGEFAARLYRGGGDLARYVQRIMEEDDNVCIRAAGRGETLPAYLAACLEEELKTLQAAASLTPEDLTQSLPEKDAAFLPRFGVTWTDLSAEYRQRLEHANRYGWGVCAHHHMFCLDDAGCMIPVGHPDPVRLEELVGYQRERELVLDNLRALLAGRPAANMLLTGDAGTGKSSTVKAAVNALRDEGLRLVEVRRDQLGQIPSLLDELSENPLKFVLFIDDLSFRKDDDSFGALKAVLEGSVSARSGNVILCATSNRRHIVRERFSDREGDDVHRSDAMQETVSLSDRFGLHITFQKPGKEAYLDIVRALARREGVACGELDMLAERFALERGGRSPRIARQFVDSLAAKMPL